MTQTKSYESYLKNEALEMSHAYMAGGYSAMACDGLEQNPFNEGSYSFIEWLDGFIDTMGRLGRPVLRVVNYGPLCDKY